MGEKEDRLIQQLRKEANVDVHDEERCRAATRNWMTTMDLMTASFAEKFGWDAVNEQLRVFWKKRAETKVKPRVASYLDQGLPGDCVTLGKMMALNAAGHIERKFLEITPGRLHIVRRGCDEALALKQAGLLGKVFWPCTTVWTQARIDVLNPKIRLTVVEAECQGGDVCDLLFELRE